MEKKQAADWWIALIHFVFGGIAIPAALGVVFMLVSIPLFGMDENGNPINPALGVVFTVLFSVVGIGATWLGAKVSAQFLQGKYVISNASRVCHLALLYFIVGDIIFILLDIFGYPPVESSISEWAIGLVETAIMIAVFYWTSKHYLVR